MNYKQALDNKIFEIVSKASQELNLESMLLVALSVIIYCNVILKKTLT